MTHVTVVGAGIAGVAAALAALREGADVMLLGHTGATDLVGGGFALLPAQGAADSLESALGALPEAHPLRAIPGDVALGALREASDAILRGLGDLYGPIGAPGARHLATVRGLDVFCAAAQRPVLDLATLPSDAVVAVTGLPGLRDFDARFVAASLGERCAARGDGRRFVAIDVELFRRRGDTLYFPHELARRLDEEPVQARVVLALRRALSATRVDAVLAPPILGLERRDVAARLSAALACPVGEAVGELGGIQGLRLRHALDRAVRDAGIVRREERVARIAPDARRLVLQDGSELATDAIVLATGKYVGGGVDAERARDRMSGGVYGGTTTATRGLAVDATLRPLDGSGAPIARRLFAAGDLLAHTSADGLGAAAATGWLAGAGAARP